MKCVAFAVRWLVRCAGQFIIVALSQRKLGRMRRCCCNCNSIEPSRHSCANSNHRRRIPANFAVRSRLAWFRPAPKKNSMMLIAIRLRQHTSRLYRSPRFISMALRHSFSLRLCVVCSVVQPLRYWFIAVMGHNFRWPDLRIHRSYVQNQASQIVLAFEPMRIGEHTCEERNLTEWLAKLRCTSLHFFLHICVAIYMMDCVPGAAFRTIMSVEMYILAQEYGPKVSRNRRRSKFS